jgi:Ca2+-binding RTX toxin-like protein
MALQPHRISSAARAASARLVEGLEARTLFAGITLAGDGTLNVVGTTGNDTISVNLTGGQVVAKLNATTKSFAVAAVKKLSLSGDAGADNISVGNTVSVPATIKGGAGNDTLKGGGGNDSLDGGTGADDMRGGPGADAADYSARTKTLFIQIEDVANDGEVNEKDNVRSDVENVTGGSAGDNIKGSFFNNVLVGGGGGDQLFGLGGNDTLRGGEGDDQLDGGDGNDTLYGDAGQDFFKGGAGADDFWGGSDPVTPADPFSGLDIVDYGDHAGYVNASLDNQRNDGGTGENDFVHADVEGLFAGRGGSTLIGNDAANYFADGPGNDEVLANGGDDTIDGGYGGNDTFYGGAGDDHVFSSGEVGTADKLYGGGGDDELEDTGGDGDLLDGGAGHDRLDKYRGTGTLVGGADADVINGVVEAGILGVVKSADGKTLTITGTGLADLIDVRPGAAGQLAVSYGGQVPVTVATAGLTQIVINAGKRSDGVVLYPGVTTPAVVNAGAGDDRVEVYDGPSEQYGGDGQDTLVGGSAADKLYGGAGSDSLSGGEGDDLLLGDAGGDSLQGGAGADRLYGGDGNDFLRGTDDNGPTTADYLDGGLGTDIAEKDNLDATSSIENVQSV